MSTTPFHRRLGARVGSRVDLLRAGVISRFAAPQSRLYVIGDGSGWVLNEEAQAIHGVARQVGQRSRVLLGGSAAGIRNQRLLHFSQFVLPSLTLPGAIAGNQIGVAYFHGRPDPQYPEFVECYQALRALHPKLWRVLVSNRAMEAVILDSGIDRAKVHRIPIGINLDYFPSTTTEMRRDARRSLDLPPDAVIVGSFQKDGQGWGDGDEPKLIKGPDVLVHVLGQLQHRIPSLHVLLSGAARGFVRRGLTTAGVPHTHRWADDYASLHRFYQACDLVLVTSREEGGPKAVLESMASGVPLVSTSVGQATDLVEEGRNGWLAPVGDVEQLVAHAVTALQLSAIERGSLLARARATAEANSYHRQLDLWRAFFA